MPELPEVETIVRALKPELDGERITSLDLFHPRVYRKVNKKRLIEVASGSVINQVKRRGKYIVLDLNPPNPGIVLHLGMSGQLLLSKKPLENKHSRALFKFEANKYLNFVDIRTFGKIFLLEGNIPDGYSTLGVEPLSTEFTSAYLARFLKGKTTDIKTLLLRQDLIAGIGNIYASEACYRAKIHPAKSGDSIKAGEIKSLHRVIRKVLGEAIEQMGTTLSDFRRPDGEPGSFSNKLRVYGHEQDPCQVCNTNINKIESMC